MLANSSRCQKDFTYKDLLAYSKNQTNHSPSKLCAPTNAKPIQLTPIPQTIP